MPSVVTFAQLPEEEPAFIAYLRKTGDVWARAVDDDPRNPQHEPLPVSDFLERFADQIVKNHEVAVYVGFRDDIFRPAIGSHEVTEGGSLVPFVQFGKVLEGVHTIVGGTKVIREFVDPMASLYVHYDRGQYRTEEELATSNLCYYSGSYRGQEWVHKPHAFLMWAKKVLGWMRRHTPESVPVHTCNYETRATIGVAKACKYDLKVR
jgi:hypothetical protein